MLKISGDEIAKKIIDELKSKPVPKKILAAVLVGKNETSINFIKQKEKVAKELGVDFRLYEFKEDLKNDDLRKEIGRVANQKPVGGIIVQLPLPKEINAHYILNAIPPEKDVDVLGERALGSLYNGRSLILPPSVGVVEQIIKSYAINLKSRKVAVVGLGFLVGKPIAVWLMGKCSEIYLLDEGSNFEILKQADLVISAVGKKNLFSAENLKEDTVVIDFGYDVDKNGKMQGDFNAEFNKAKGINYTPTPGGTGPILVAKLFENFYKLNK